MRSPNRQREWWASPGTCQERFASLRDGLRPLLTESVRQERAGHFRSAPPITAPQHCAYPGCDQPPAARGSDRGAKPKYCDDPDHNPLSGHRERRRREAEASGQRTEETGGQPVTFGLTRASELVSALEKITS